MPATASRTSSSTTTNGSSTEQRACDAADCRTGKLINKVAKRKTAQFITQPYIQEKPVLVNGLTSVFQVGGMGATLSDIKPASGDSEKIQPVYCIKPDSHVHIINYIVVDDDSEVLRKISENDADTMRILVASQKQSAEAKLRKLIANHDITTKRAVAQQTQSAASAATAAAKEQTAGTTPAVVPSALQAALATPTLTTSAVQRTSVAQTSGSGSASKTKANTSAATETRGVGLAIGSVAQRVNFTTPAVPAATIDKLQEELDELRRTVARLAAQAN